MLDKILNITNNQQIIQVLMTKLFKIMNNPTPRVMDYMFPPRVNTFKQRKFYEFAIGI